MNFNVTEAADQLGVTPYWLQQQARLKKVPHLRAGRFYKFTPDHIRQIEASWEVQPKASSDFAPTERSNARRRSA